MTTLTAELRITLDNKTNNVHNIQNWVAQQTTLTVEDWFVENNMLYITPFDLISNDEIEAVLTKLTRVFDNNVEYVVSVL